MAVNTDIPCIFRYGTVISTSDYTPSGSAIVAGFPVVIGNMVAIPTRAIPDGYLGALNTNGGVYECVGDAAISAGKDVWWDATNKKVTETATSNKFFGHTITACAADEGTCLVEHSQTRLVDLDVS